MTLDPLLEELAARMAELIAQRLNGHGAVPPRTGEADRLLDVHQAAELLGVTPRWLYRRAKTLPFAKRLSRGVLRFSESGLRDYMAAGRRGGA